MTGAANAAVNFSDNFDGESAPGESKLNYTGFANWDVIGQVDLVSTPNPYDTNGVGNYVDLDGTAGPGAIVSKQAFAFAAGDFVTFSFQFSGNQRDQNFDTFSFGLDFDGPGTLLNLQLDGGPSGNFAYSAFNHTGISFLVGPNDAWRVATYTFTTSAAGSAKIYFGTTSADNVGPMVDNVSLTAVAVPEPATWAMMIMGFGAAGAVLRRRRTALAA
ncbi:MAG: PEPxxWA-CTERM sorting domain-containing protein [Alphaproteobacteria bacterium]|nr:PEPxxWA-CTERM sorting domain-containing protein [Alphaproteobacteria bacterium]MBU1513306.1 PEPxxWA-CTERM sorting domain-containing protein [Alphaproteobacteria bacterium]MBU2095925.1 PEPxxWA-CTERM sorting domain-containing protein [Alphaproteobacteria bacterium]MBU2152149.1 PEPxxWA-CTERM sorting domain-containing protein [Alphaproteobacteria bacterium]MBU2306195.1 PEPxxWA-CTERM sorting domain-containing protein [Alphaproteobacteria bacterium]